MKSDSIWLAGILALVGGLEYLFGLFVAESVYPGYQVGQNPISDLGATCRPEVSCIVQQPAATIFTVLMLTLGACVIVAGFLLYRSTAVRAAAVLLALGGVGALGAGIFSEAWAVHSLFAFMAFFFTPLAALTGLRLLSPSLRPFGAVLGATALFGLGWQLLGSIAGSSWFGALGDGGVERVIVYPVLFWLILVGCSVVIGREASLWSIPAAARSTPLAEAPSVRSGQPELTRPS